MNSELLSVRPPRSNSEPIAIVSAISGDNCREDIVITEAGWSISGPFHSPAQFYSILLLDLGKIDRERHLAAVGRKNRDRRRSHGIEIAIGKRCHHLGLEPGSFRPGGAPIGLTVEPHRHRLDRFAGLI